jgi:ribonuclease HII
VPFLIGTDEAGYGPNLGPLTITGTLWETPTVETDLYRALADVVANKDVDGKLFIADSKNVYRPKGSIEKLETSVLSFLLATTGVIPTDWSELVDLVWSQSDQFADERLDRQVWLTGHSLKLPLKADIETIHSQAKRFKACCRKNSVALKRLCCVPIFAQQFNSQVDELGNKATLLSTETLKIVRQLLDQADDDVEVGCDKHGGRSKYAALLQQCVTQEFVMVGAESLDVSDYSFRESDRDVVIRFQAKGESFLPTALASMVSKYVREVVMVLWNQFWQTKIPNLKPTKGYPVDAKRFKSDIAKMQAELGIADESIWRKR